MGPRQIEPGTIVDYGRFTEIRVVNDPKRQVAGAVDWKPKCISHDLGGCGYAGSRFVCAHCYRAVCWCSGAHDDMPDACDQCWADAHRS